MNVATIAEPFLLSSYPESSAYKKRQVAPLFASAPSGSNADPFVPVAVQGDGVHVLDASTLHPAVSHILGPSTSFSCSPATRISRTTAGTRKCASYAILESGADVRPEGKGKTVVAWEEELSGGVSSSARDEKKRTTVIPHPVSHVYAPECLPENLVLVSASGDLSLLDEDLRVLRACTPQNHQSSALLKHFLFPSSSCSFLPPHTASTYGGISVSFLRSGDVLRLDVVGMDGETITSLGECVLPVEDTDLLDISCSNAGFISILLPSGTWLALSLSTSPSGSLSIAQAAEPLRLQGLTFIGTTRTSEATLAALTSSHVLLSAVTSGSPLEIVTLLWDLRYGVLLAQQSIPVPSTLPRPKKHGAVLRLQVSPSPASSPGSTKTSMLSLNAVLVLHPSPEREHQTEPGSVPARSTVLVIPVTVSLTSTIAAAMGKANAGARWVSTKPGGPIAQGQGQTTRVGPELSAGARKALREIKAALDGSANGSTAAVETVFFEYVKQQSKGKGTAQGEEQSTPVEYPVVQGVLEFVLRAPSHVQSKAQTAAYSSKIVRHLLESRVVSSSMVEGGVLPALAERNDWGTAVLAMRKVTDLPENDIISLLGQVVKAHASSADVNAMQVDSPPTSTATPVLPTFLAQCVVYPFTPALQRTAIRKHLPDAADLVPVLEVLDGWIVQHTADDAFLSVTASGGATEGEPSNVPPLNKVLTFLQSLLDASFLALLAHPPAHKRLARLTAHIQPALAQTNELELLCGPLEPFARAAAAKAKAQTEAKEGGKPDSGKDWRRKRKLAHEQAGVAVGLYQVEELVL
ncbi:hypothetical protein LXA43DRAFT_652845 [Ganoderma leucocontextum]|nr:hypothetical protein LXA43DRAFT_652845 [Ganoderma leucocontextum]